MSSVETRTTRSLNGLVDSYGRPVKSMRVSVTQRCDLECSHCHREGQRRSSVEMTSEELERLVGIAASLGVRKIKLTGGEPLLRDDIAEIVLRVSSLADEVSLTTNGSRLERLAIPLKEAGLRRINVSLHSLDPRIYSALCGVDKTDEVVRGIIAATQARLSPVKVNMVVLKDENDQEIQSMIDFCGKVGAVLQLIELAANREGSNGKEFSKKFFSLRDFEQRLAREAVDTALNELHRRRQYRIRSDGGLVAVEVVRPMHNTEFCSNCTRIRLSSDGKLKPCLLDSSGEVDLLTPLRTGASDSELQELFVKGVSNRRPYWR